MGAEKSTNATLKDNTQHPTSPDAVWTKKTRQAKRHNDKTGLPEATAQVLIRQEVRGEGGGHIKTRVSVVLERFGQGTHRSPQ